MYGFSLKHYMCITPDSPRKSPHITFGQIHTAYKSHKPVDNDNLTVIPIIYFTRKQRETYFQKATHLNTGSPHIFKESTRHVPTSYIVVDNPHFNSGTCFPDQNIAH